MRKFLVVLVGLVGSLLLTELLISYVRGIVSVNRVNIFQSVLIFALIAYTAYGFARILADGVAARETGVLVGMDYCSKGGRSKFGLWETLQGAFLLALFLFLVANLVTWHSPLAIPSLSPLVFWNDHSTILELPLWLSSLFMILRAKAVFDLDAVID